MNRNRAVRAGPFEPGGQQRRLGRVRHLQPDPHGPLDGFGAHVQLGHAVLEAVADLLQLGREVLLQASEVHPGLVPPDGDQVVDVEAVIALPEHPGLYALGQHRRHRAQVVADVVHLLGHPEQEGVVVADGFGGAVGAVARRSGEMVDLDVRALLAVAVHPPVALLHPVGVERDLHVDQPVALPVEVDPLGGRVGGQQDADLGGGRVVVELPDDPLPLVGSEAAVEHLHPIPHRRPVGVLGGEHLVQVVQRGPVLGEDDHPLVVPSPVRVADPADPVEKPLGLGVGAAVVLVCPFSELLEDFGG